MLSNEVLNRVMSLMLSKIHRSVDNVWRELESLYTFKEPKRLRTSLEEQISIIAEMS